MASNCTRRGTAGRRRFSGSARSSSAPGNSGAQIAAEPADVTAVRWVTRERPRFLPDVIEANGRVRTDGARSVVERRLWLVGYGDWTGYASATLIGVGRSARAAVDQITDALLAMDPAGRGGDAAVT